MKPSDIKKQRVESILKELIPEALAKLSDERLHGLGIVDVVCKRGLYDANVYIDPSFYDESEKKIILKQLKMASRHVESYCLEVEGWFKCPKFHYKFDEDFEKTKNLEALFAQISKDRKS